MSLVQGFASVDIEVMNSFLCGSMIDALTRTIGIKTPSLHQHYTRLPRTLVDELAFKNVEVKTDFAYKQTWAAGSEK